jgi:hypothetical protein
MFKFCNLKLLNGLGTGISLLSSTTELCIILVSSSVLLTKGFSTGFNNFGCS